MNTERRSNDMELTSDLIVIHERLLRGARRRKRTRLRTPAAASFVAVGAVVVTSAALAAGLGLVKFSWINVGGKGGLEIASVPTLPASLAGVPVATVLANDPNLEACDGGVGWIASTAMVQSPHAPGTMAGCGTPTQAERAAYRISLLQSNPRLARPFRYWYEISTESVAAGEGRPGAARAMGQWYLGSPVPLAPAQIKAWRDDMQYVISGVGHPPSPTALSTTAPLPRVAREPQATGGAGPTAVGASKPSCWQMTTSSSGNVGPKPVPCKGVAAVAATAP
jgi:hypothetical protein